MLALLKQKEFDLNNYKTVFVIFIKDKKVIQILIPKSYFIAIANLIYKLE
jgi:hypothetical protein